MWRARTTSQSRQIVNAAKRHLATESTPPVKSNVPPLTPPQPKPPKSSSFRLFKFFGFGLPIAATSLLGYVWYDPNFRKQLEANIPYAKELLGNILPEEKEEKEKDRNRQPDFPIALEKATKLNVQENQTKAPLNETKESNNETKDIPLLKEEPVPIMKEESKSKIDPRIIDAQIKKKEDDEKADNAALEVVIHKLMNNCQNLTEMAVQAEKDLAASISNHTKLLKQAMDDTSDILGKDAQWEAVSIAHTEREQAMMKANELAVESKKSIEKLREVLSEGKKSQVTKQNPAIIPASKKVTDLLRDLNIATNQVRQAEAEANVMQKYKDLVEKGKKQFQKELESLLPDVKIGSGKLMAAIFGMKF